MTKSWINDFLKNNTDSKILKHGKDYLNNGNVEQFIGTYNKSGYNRGFALIQHLYNFGGKEHSIKLIEYLKKEYPKRDAMIEVLNQLEVDV